MALATRCPNCQALFRVVADQLKLRGGLVRCGACRHVFDAIGSLTYLDDAATGVMQTPAAAPPPVPKKSSAPPTLFLTTEAARTPPPRPRKQPAGETRGNEAQPPALDVPTLLAADAGEGAARVTGESEERSTAPRADSVDAEAAPAVETPAPPPPRRQRRREPQAPAATEPSTAAEPMHSRREFAPTAPLEEDAEVEPAFLQRARKSYQGFSIVFGGGSALLAVLLLLQLAVLFRTELVTRWPGLRPPLLSLCQVAGCTLGWPTRAELLAVVGTELQAIPGTDVLELTAIVRNRASFNLALPAVEVTLTDTQNRALARKVFAPVDYLASSGEPSNRIDDGLAAGADYTIKITFEARGIAAAGFVVYPFYL
ncbi:MAG TPA: DUF3426 domain-containing protein [Burkholderiaceae bacterium]|nr:DUF3426 domain-containing protein [Burkholderiaceae bacterium]